jgi:predicted TIM-barrel fold metal-dependent hydrolase
MTPTTQTRLLIVSADSHVGEPREIYHTRLPAAMRERARQADTRHRNRYLHELLTLIAEGPDPAAEAAAAARRRLSEDQEEATAPGGAADPVLRRQDMQRDGIAAEVIYPTLGLFIHSIPDPDLQLACARVYNDWAYETFGSYFDIFMPAAIVPVLNVEAGIQELERAAKLGFRCAAVPAAAPEGQPYNEPVYEPFWTAAEAAQMALSFHVGTGHSPILARGAGGAVINYAYVGIVAQQTVCFLTASGVLARHPGLHVAIVEGGAGWLAWVLERMDEAYTEHYLAVQPKLDMLPSEYYKRQGHASFQVDRSALKLLDLTGPDVLIWGSDYPHPEGTWPHSQEKLAEQFREVPEATKRKIVGETAARIYRFPLSNPSNS